MEEKDFDVISNSKLKRYSSVLLDVIIQCALIGIIVLVAYAEALGGDGLSWGRIRYRPEIIVEGIYDDNIYQENENETSDIIGMVSPDISFDLAVAPRNYFSLRYRGDFWMYQDADNFMTAHHLGELSYRGETAKGSHIKVGAQKRLTAVQPYSETDRFKEYTFQYYFGDIAFIVFDYSKLGMSYSYSRREFDESQYSDDDYTRNTVDLYFLHNLTTVFPLLLQYRFIGQDNNDSGLYSTDFNSHTFFLGGHWDPGRKLAGDLRVGYFIVDFDQQNIENFDGFAVDTRLDYEFTEITSISLLMERGVNQPTLSERETGDFYVYTDASLLIKYHKWTKIEVRLFSSYSVRDYKDIFAQENLRQDRLYRLGFTLSYILNSWITFALDYHYQQRNSDSIAVEYTENVAAIRIVLGSI